MDKARGLENMLSLCAREPVYAAMVLCITDKTAPASSFEEAGAFYYVKDNPHILEMNSDNLVVRVIISASFHVGSSIISLVIIQSASAFMPRFLPSPFTFLAKS